MKKPTLEEVKEHFKDAKVVKSLFGRGHYKGRLDINDFHWWNNGIWCQTQNRKYCLHVWSQNKGYAEIVEYKDSIIGKYIRGFQFNDNDPNIVWNPEMCQYTGDIGVITKINNREGYVRVRFSDYTEWSYPIHMIKNHMFDGARINLQDGTKIEFDVKDSISTDGREFNVLFEEATTIPPGLKVKKGGIVSKLNDEPIINKPKNKQMETNQNNTEFQLSFETVGGVDVILTGQNLDNLATIANMIK